MLAPMLINYYVNSAFNKNRALYSNKIPDYWECKLGISLMVNLY